MVEMTPQSRRSRNIQLVLLGVATFAVCSCCLFPAPAEEEEVVEGANFGEVTDDGSGTTATTAKNYSSNTNHSTRTTSGYRGPFWFPLIFGGGSSRPSGGSYTGSNPSNRPGVSTGGFGGTGRSVSGSSSS
jgi:hypothetical protein